MHHVIDYDEKCKSCNGTGLYIGLGERDGFAVVCQTCKGTGKHHVHVEYDDFEGRIAKSGISRVVRANVGICLGKNPAKGITAESFGGMSYADWLASKPFPPRSEDRLHVCPAWWYQSVDYNKRPNWPECGMCFPDCKYFKSKAACWRRWDEEQAAGQPQP